MKTTIIKERLQSALIGILFIAVFLPFGLNHFGWMRWVLLVGLGVIIAFSVLVSEYVVEKVFRMPNDISRGSQYIIRRNIRFESINILLGTTLMCLFLDAFANNEVVFTERSRRQNNPNRRNLLSAQSALSPLYRYRFRESC